MQNLQKRRDSENAIVCPKCNTQNPSSQKRCGRCGYVFPKAVNKERKEESGFPTPQIPTRSQFGGQGEQESDSPPENEQHSEPSVPKALSDRGQREGHLRSIGMKTICKNCGAENNLQATRCIRCGNKFVERK